MKKIFAAAALTAAAITVAPAGAQSGAALAPGCFGLLFKDKAGDASRTHPSFAGTAAPDNLDITEGWVDVKGGKSSIFMRVKNLDKTVPNGATAVIWQANYVGKAGTAVWVRAVTDFTGLVTYDHGGLQDTPVIPFNVRAGGTTGAFTAGPDGVVQIDFPETVEPKGQVLKTFGITASEAVQVIPGAAPTPVKGGLLYEADNASGGKGTFTIGAECPAEAPAAPAETPGDPGTPGEPSGQSADRPLPVTVKSRTFKAKQVKKGMTLKLASSEPITQLGAQLKKGKKVFGKGKLARLDGNGTLKLKAKRLKKGSYVLDLVGSDSTGARRFTAAKIKVR